MIYDISSIINICSIVIIWNEEQPNIGICYGAFRKCLLLSFTLGLDIAQLKNTEYKLMRGTDRLAVYPTRTAW